MSALHDAARRVVAAWSSTRRTWVEDVNATVMALDAALKAQAEPAQEPVAKMTAGRAVYFMERFKREEKLLGPNEQAALDFVISMLQRQPEPVKPVAWIAPDGSLRKTPGAKSFREWAWGPNDFKPLYTAPPQRPPLTVPELQQALVDAGIIFPEAIDDAEGFDHGVTLERIDALHAAIIKTTGGAA